MAVRTDGTKRWVELELVVPGALDQVWRAVATGGGITAWFARCQIDERVGGRVEFDFGPHGISRGEVTVWEPSTRFSYVERAWCEGAPACETDISLNTRSDGHVVFRMLHTLRTTSGEWDASLEGFEKGWQGFFEVLKLYLFHFAGEPAASFQVLAVVDGSLPQIWQRLTDSLALNAAACGEERLLSGSPGEFNVVIEQVRQSEAENYLVLRLKESTPGVALLGASRAGETNTVSLLFYFYGDEAEQRVGASQLRWQEWAAEIFSGKTHPREA